MFINNMLAQRHDVTKTNYQLFKHAERQIKKKEASRDSAFVPRPVRAQQRIVNRAGKSRESINFPAWKQ